MEKIVGFGPVQVVGGTVGVFLVHGCGEGRWWSRSVGLLLWSSCKWMQWSRLVGLGSIETRIED